MFLPRCNSLIKGGSTFTVLKVAKNFFQNVFEEELKSEITAGAFQMVGLINHGRKKFIKGFFKVIFDVNLGRYKCYGSLV